MITAEKFTVKRFNGNEFHPAEIQIAYQICGKIFGIVGGLRAVFRKRYKLCHRRNFYFPFCLRFALKSIAVMPALTVNVFVGKKYFVFACGIQRYIFSAVFIFILSVGNIEFQIIVRNVLFRYGKIENVLFVVVVIIFVVLFDLCKAKLFINI